MIITHDSSKITHPYFNDPTNRWLTDLSNDQHHSLPAISSSAVKYFHKNSPWAFHQKYVLRKVKSSEFKPEFRMGHLIHLAILEPEKFDKCIGICDEASNTNKYKDFRREFLNSFRNEAPGVDGIPRTEAPTSDILKEAEGDVYQVAAKLSEQIQEAKKKRNSKKNKSPELIKDLKEESETNFYNTTNLQLPFPSEIIIEDMDIRPSKNGGYYINTEGDEVFLVKSLEMEMLRRIQDNIQNHARISLMLNQCQYIEQSGIAQCPKTGLFLSVRGDARSDQGYFLDPKSIANLSRHSMESSQASFQYYLQHIHYLYVANLIEPAKYDRFYFMYISKESPYEVCITHLDQEDIELAERLYFKILNEIAKCEKLQKWPTLDNGNGMTINVPRWAF